MFIILIISNGVFPIKHIRIGRECLNFKIRNYIMIFDYHKTQVTPSGTRWLINYRPMISNKIYQGLRIQHYANKYWKIFIDANR